MRSHAWFASALGLTLSVSSCLPAVAQEAGEVDANDYNDYFGDNRRPSRQSDGDSPHSLDEARMQGKAYRLGQVGNVNRKPTRETHTVHEGDTLWDISERYFGDPWHWPELWSYNPEITNPHWIYPLDRVRLAASAGSDDAVASAAAGKKGTGQTGFREPGQGLASDLAPRVMVPAKLLENGAIFLRDEGYLDDTEIKESGQLTAASEEHMLLSDSDTVYVHFPKGRKVAVGQQYTVYRPVHEDEREAGEHGHLVRIQGTVLIGSYDAAKGMARATITETIDPIERGMPVTLMDRRFILEPPRPNQVNVSAQIIGSVQPRTLLSYGNVVFLNVGRSKNVQPGNRFFVVRRGDNWLDVMDHPPDQMGNILPIPDYHKDELPKEVVAELRVLKVRKNVTIAIITRSNTDVFQGDKAEMRVGY